MTQSELDMLGIAPDEPGLIPTPIESREQCLLWVLVMRSECHVIQNALSNTDRVTTDRPVSFHILQEGTDHHNKVQFNENFSTKVGERKGLLEESNF